MNGWELKMADGSSFLDYLRSAAPATEKMDEWTQGHEECKRRLLKVLESQLVRIQESEQAGSGEAKIYTKADAENLCEVAVAAHKAAHPPASAGMVMVPVEPTEAMLQAAHAAVWTGTTDMSDHEIERREHAAKYKAMIEAAAKGRP